MKRELYWIGLYCNSRCTFLPVRKAGNNFPADSDCHLDSNRSNIQIPSTCVLSAGYHRHLSDNWVI